MYILLGGSKGGGTQGRESKTRSTKKKYNRGHDADDSDDDTMVSPAARGDSRLEFMSLDEMEETLGRQSNLDGCPDDFLSELAQQLYRWGKVFGWG